MDLPNLKELEKLFKLCRKQGITDLTLPELVIKFGDLPREEKEAEAGEELGSNSPSEEELLFWSTQPDPLSTMMDKQ